MNKIYENLSSSSKVLVAIAAVMVVFSGWNIYTTNKRVANTCERRVYTAHTKGEEVSLSDQEKSELMRKISTCEEIFKTTGFRPFDEVKYEGIFDTCPQGNSEKRCAEIQSCRMTGIDKYKKAVETGYKINEVPDEAARAKSREEVKDYENCKREQEIAIKNKSEGIGYLIPGNLIILAVGLLVFFALKNSKKD